MCKFKKYVAAALLLSSLLSSPSYAALIEIVATENTVNTSGSITYTPGSSFIVRAVFDTNVTKSPANSTFGTTTGQSAIVSFELNTEMGQLSI